MPDRAADPPEVEVRRSARRRRTVSAYRREGTVVVLIPARFTRREEAEWVERMVERVLRSEQRTRRSRGSDEALMRRAGELSREHLGGRAVPASVRWVANMSTRWGSCTTLEATIRLSDRLRSMPPWVVDYVLLHELAHLLEPGHDAAFWALVEAYPRAQRAQGYLEGYAAAADRP